MTILYCIVIILLRQSYHRAKIQRPNTQFKLAKSPIVTHLFGWWRKLEWTHGENMQKASLLEAFNTEDGGKFTLCQENELVKKKKKSCMLWLVKATWGLVGTWCSCPPPICWKVWYEGNGGQIIAARLCSESWGTQHPTESVERGQHYIFFTQDYFHFIWLKIYFFAQWHMCSVTAKKKKRIAWIIVFRSESTSF